MSRSVALWGELSEIITKWYDSPDLQGYKIVLCTFVSHFYLINKPIWLLILGPPGTGKTSLGINPINSLSNLVPGVIHPITELTTKSFLSGYGENMGILKRMVKYDNDKRHGIITFQDLTSTFLAENPIERTKIVGQMRGIYDGYFMKEVGVKQKVVDWKGKVTCLAACTPNLEDFWTLNQDMGERWIKLRWKHSERDRNIGLKAIRQASRSDRMEDEIFGKTRELVELAFETDSVDDFSEHEDLIVSFAMLVEAARTNVKREHVGNKFPIIGLGNKQSPARVSLNFVSLLQAATALRGVKVIAKEDLQLVARLALDNIPRDRLAVIKYMIRVNNQWVDRGAMWHDIEESFGKSRTAFYRTVEDMVFLKILQQAEGDPQEGEIVKEVRTKLKITDEIVHILRICKLIH